MEMCNTLSPLSVELWSDNKYERINTQEYDLDKPVSRYTLLPCRFGEPKLDKNTRGGTYQDCTTPLPGNERKRRRHLHHPTQFPPTSLTQAPEIIIDIEQNGNPSIITERHWPLALSRNLLLTEKRKKKSIQILGRGEYLLSQYYLPQKTRVTILCSGSSRPNDEDPRAVNPPISCVMKSSPRVRPVNRIGEYLASRRGWTRHASSRRSRTDEY